MIGGSIARAARGLDIVDTIVATSRSEPTRQRIRELGLADDVADTAAAAIAFRVGYDSPSQFNREYGRLFGVTPARDAARLRKAAGQATFAGRQF